MAISAELKRRALPDAIAHYEAYETTSGPTWHELIDAHAKTSQSFVRARDFAVHMALTTGADRVSGIGIARMLQFGPTTSR